MEPTDFLMPISPQLMNKHAHIDQASSPIFPDTLKAALNDALPKERLRPLRSKKKPTSRYIIGTIEIISLSIVSLLIIQNINAKKQSAQLLELTDSQQKQDVTTNTSNSEKNTLGALNNAETQPNQALATPQPLQSDPNEKETQNEVIEDLRKQVKQINSTLTLLQNKLTRLERKPDTPAAKKHTPPKKKSPPNKKNG